MSADKEFIDLLNINEVDRVIAQRANAEALRDARAAGRAEGQEQARKALLASKLAVLTEKVLISKSEFQTRFGRASLEQLQDLLIASLKFTSPADLEAWEKTLAAHKRKTHPSPPQAGKPKPIFECLPPDRSDIRDIFPDRER